MLGTDGCVLLSELVVVFRYDVITNFRNLFLSWGLRRFQEQRNYKLSYSLSFLGCDVFRYDVIMNFHDLFLSWGVTAFSDTT